MLEDVLRQIRSVRADPNQKSRAARPLPASGLTGADDEEVEVETELMSGNFQSCLHLLYTDDYLEVSRKAQLPFIASLASPRHKCVTASVEHTGRNHSHRFCLVSRFGLAAITGAARLNPARTVPARAPRWS